MTPHLKTQARHASSASRAAMMTVSAVIALQVLGGCAQSNLGPELPQTSSIDNGSNAARPTDQKAHAAKIALVLPLAGYGESAQIARGMKQAAEMALFEANNPAIQLIVKDDGGTPQGAMAAADSAIAEGAEIILGPLFGKSVTAIAPIARRANVPVVAFSNDPAVAGNGTYLMSFLASEEVHRVVSFVASQGKRRFAALIPDTAYGRTVEPAFRDAVTNSGGTLSAIEIYPADSSGMLASAKRVLQTISDAERAGAPVDALFVPAGRDQISQLGPLLVYSGFNSAKLKMLGTSAWDVPVFSRDDVLIGGWYAASDPAGWSAFAEKYRKTFGTVPPRLATLSYDAMSMALTLAATSGPARFSAAALTNPQGFVVSDGIVRLTANGLSTRNLAVLEIEKTRTVVIDAAPQSGAPQAFATAAQP